MCKSYSACIQSTVMSIAPSASKQCCPGINTRGLSNCWVIGSTGEFVIALVLILVRLLLSSIENFGWTLNYKDRSLIEVNRKAIKLTIVNTN